jgi:hypothetical protein
MTSSAPDVVAAQVALREATRALAIADRLHRARSGVTDLDGAAARGLAADVGHALDAVASVLRQVSPEPAPRSTDRHDLQALCHHVRDGAAMARHISGVDGRATRAFAVAGRPGATQDD